MYDGFINGEPFFVFTVQTGIMTFTSFLLLGLLAR